MKVAVISLLIPFTIISMILPDELTAQEIKPGLIDYNIILQRMPEMRAVEQRVQNLSERKIAQIRRKQQEFQIEVERFEQRISVISETAREAEEERLISLQVELNQLQADAEQELFEEQQRLMRPVLQQIRDSIARVASENGITFVLKNRSFDGTQIILYTSQEAIEKYDITDSVMRDLGI